MQILPGSEIIRGAGLKLTPQRIAIIQALIRLHHPSAEEIYREIQGQIPGLSPTTVYSTLDSFVKCKIISRVQTHSGVMRYDAVKPNHHHLYSSFSERMEDFHDPNLDNMLENYFNKKKITGFRISEIRLQIIGEFLD